MANGTHEAVHYGYMFNISEQNGSDEFRLRPEQEDSTTLYLKAVLSGFENIGEPLIFTLGIVFNTLMVAVCLRTDLKKISAFLIIVALGITDNVYLMAKMIYWISRKVHPINNIGGVCQIAYYSLLLSIFVEWWMTVLLLGERVTMLYRPRISKSKCSPFRMKCVLLVFSIFAIVAHLYHTWTIAVIEIRGHYMCMIIPENSKNIYMLRKVDIVFSFILPALLIMIFMFLCVLKVIYNSFCRRNVRKDATARTSIDEGDVTPSRYFLRARVRKIFLKSFNHRKFSRSNALSLYCLLLSGIFLILCVPHDFIKTKITFAKSPLATIIDGLVFGIFSEVYSINFAFKGIYLLLISPQYRRACVLFCKVLICRCVSAYSLEDKIQQTDI